MRFSKSFEALNESCFSSITVHSLEKYFLVKRFRIDEKKETHLLVSNGSLFRNVFALDMIRLKRQISVSQKPSGQIEIISEVDTFGQIMTKSNKRFFSEEVDNIRKFIESNEEISMSERDLLNYRELNRKNSKRKNAIVFGAITVISLSWLVLFMTILSSCDPYVTYQGLGEYQECLSCLSYSIDFMPNVDEILSFETIEMYCAPFLGITVSSNLIITYSNDEYVIYKSLLLDNYDFLQVPVEGYNEGEYFIPEVEFEYEGFLFKVVDDEKAEFNFQYPHYFGMIGYNDITKQISYVYFEDMSLDYITSMPQFMDSYVRFNSAQ